MKEGRRSGGDDTVTTKGFDGDPALIDGSGKIGLPDVATRNEAEGEDKGSGFDSSDGELELSRTTDEVDVETGDRELGSKVNVSVETTEIGR